MTWWMWIICTICSIPVICLIALAIGYFLALGYNRGTEDFYNIRPDGQDRSK